LTNAFNTKTLAFGKLREVAGSASLCLQEEAREMVNMKIMQDPMMREILLDFAKSQTENNQKI
jgi:hypothetical protein